MSGLQYFKRGRRQPGYFFELVGQMRHAAIVELVGYLGQAELAGREQFLDPVNFELDDVLLNGTARGFRKQVGEVSVVVAQPSAEVLRILQAGLVPHRQHHVGHGLPERLIGSKKTGNETEQRRRSKKLVENGATDESRTSC